MRKSLAPILRIAPEGWAFLLVLGLLAAHVAWSEQFGWLVPLAVLALVTGLFFQERPRRVVARPSGILAPVDGVVCFRRECHDHWFAREAIRIRIAVPWFCNYLLRAPVEGEVVAIPGVSRRISAIRTDQGEAVVLVVARGWMLGQRPMVAAFGDRIGQGRHCGQRRLARIIDLYLPADCRVEVTLGQTIKCGETVLATLLRRSA